MTITRQPKTFHEQTFSCWNARQHQQHGALVLVFKDITIENDENGQRTNSPVNTETGLRTIGDNPTGLHNLNKQCIRYIKELKEHDQQIRIDLKA